MNPILKWRQYQVEQIRKKRLIKQHAITKDGQINPDWMIHQLQILEKYYCKINAIEWSPRVKKLHKIILIALLKHLRANNIRIFKAALKQKLLQQVNS